MTIIPILEFQAMYYRRWLSMGMAVLFCFGAVLPVVSAQSTTEVMYEICEGGAVQIGPADNFESGTCFRWFSDNVLDNDNTSNNNTLDCFDCQNPIAMPNMTTKYELVITDGQGNLIRKEIHIVKISNETFEVSVLTTDPVICLSEPPGFTGDGMGERNSTCGTATLFLEQSYFQYEWSTGETSSEITVEIGGTYAVTVTNENGCMGIGEISINEDYCVEVYISANTTAIGSGEEAMLEVEEGFESYTWFLDGEVIEGANGNTYTADVGGVFSVEVVDENGCLGRSEVVIEVVDGPHIAYSIATIKKYNNPSELNNIDPVPNTTISNGNSIMKEAKNGETIYLCQNQKKNSTITLIAYEKTLVYLSDNAQWSDSPNGALIDSSFPAIGPFVTIKLDQASTSLNGSTLTVTDGDISISIKIVIVGIEATKNSNHAYAWDAVEDEIVNGFAFDIQEYIDEQHYIDRVGKGVPWMFVKGGDKGVADIKLEPAGINSLITLEDVESSLNLSTTNPSNDNFVLTLNSNSLTYNETLIEAIVNDTESPDEPFCRCPVVQALNSGIFELDVFYTYLIEENDDHEQVPFMSSITPGQVVITANKADGTGNGFLDTNLADYSNTTDFAEDIQFINGVEQRVIKYIGNSPGQSVIPANNTNLNSPIDTSILISDSSSIQNQMNSIIFNKIGINWTLTYKDSIIVNYDFNRNGMLKATDSANERDIVQMTTEQLIPNTPSMPGYHEMLFFAPQIDPNFAVHDNYYCYLSTKKPETISHEIGHSLGHLEHPFWILGHTAADPVASPPPPHILNKDYYNLMNYTFPSFEKQILRYFQWRGLLLKADFREDKRKP